MCWHGKHIAGGTILFLTLLMIVMFHVDRSNRPLMKDDWVLMRCRWIRILFRWAPLIANFQGADLTGTSWSSQRQECSHRRETHYHRRWEDFVSRIVMDKTVNGKESLKITTKSPTLGGRLRTRLQRKRWDNQKPHNRLDRFSRGAPSTTGPNGSPYWSD
jgi:hypothetical protein